MRILLISDIHGNFPALKAIEEHFHACSFDYIINCGDSLVYGPFPNETMSWLETNATISILGNTDKKVIKLLKGKTFKKPSDPDKRIMYNWTAKNLDEKSQRYLLGLKNKAELIVSSRKKQLQKRWTIVIFHGSPARPHEFLFNSTADERFSELASMCKAEIIVCGHSHDPFHKHFGLHHFVNPGSVGRMFDGNPEASCAILELNEEDLQVNHFRIRYDVEKTIQGLRHASLPTIYDEMYRLGRKTN
jgi:putative phosphoesterase